MKLTHLKPRTIIFSVSRADRSVIDNDTRSRALIGLLEEFGVGYKVVEGFYEGNRETSFVVNAKHERLVRVLAETAGQEAYLYLDEYREAYMVDLVDNDETRRPIGKWVHSHARPTGNYTRDGEHFYEVI